MLIILEWSTPVNWEEDPTSRQNREDDNVSFSTKATYKQIQLT